MDIDYINNEILKFTKKCFGSNLLFFALVGSAGKDNYIDGWSDLDFFVVVKSYDGQKFGEVLDYSVGFDCHVGLTIFTEKECVNVMGSQRVLKILYELNCGKNKILFKEQSFNLPVIDKNKLFQNNQREIFSLLNKLKNTNKNKTREIFKIVCTLQKELLLTRRKIVYYYTDIDTEFQKTFDYAGESLSQILSSRNDANFTNIIENYRRDFIKFLLSLDWKTLIS